jgi:toxin FitB
VGLIFSRDFAGRVLPFDSTAARAYATLAAGRRLAGRPMSQADAQIAAIVLSRGGGLATRNVADFAGCGFEVIDPWK